MTNTFQMGETVVCSITVKDADGALQDPVTSMNIQINKNTGNKEVIVASTAMTKDSTGTYHYDWSSGSNVDGVYLVTYTATDGTRITISRDTLNLT